MEELTSVEERHVLPGADVLYTLLRIGSPSLPSTMGVVEQRTLKLSLKNIDSNTLEFTEANKLFSDKEWNGDTIASPFPNEAVSQE